MFPALKLFKLKNLETCFWIWDAIKETQGEQILFPQIEKLSKKCQKLVYLPKAPKVGVLELKMVSKRSEQSDIEARKHIKNQRLSAL